MDENLASALAARWSALLDHLQSGADWSQRSLRPVALTAAGVPELRELFPFTSMNRRCFSRCSEFPYTFDCPCIEANDGQYWVLSTWAVSDERAPVLASGTDAADAVAVVVQHLPEDRFIWIGPDR